MLINTCLFMAAINWLVSQSRKPSSVIVTPLINTNGNPHSLILSLLMFCTNVFFNFFPFKCIDAARDVWDTELTARAGESYNRAYGV